MNLIDILIILIILLFGVIGWQKGFLRTIVETVGLILVFILAFYLKNPIAEWMSLNLPFFNFWGAFKGVTILNVIIYQLIAFIIVFALLMIVYGIVVKLTNVIQKLLKATVILEIPSKILGLIVGLIEGIVICTVGLMILSLPIFGFERINNSKVKQFLFESTPGIGNMMENTSTAIREINDLRKDFSSDSKKDEFNKECLNIMLKYNVVTEKYADKLIKSGKLNLKNVETVEDLA